MPTYAERTASTKRLQVSLSKELHDAVMATAAANDLSASFLVNRIVRDWYAKGQPITIDPEPKEAIQ